MNKSRLKFLFWIFFNVIIFLFLSSFLDRSMFSVEIDGFYSQVSSFDAGNNQSNSLSYMHRVRYIIAYPFFFIKENNMSNTLEHILFVIYCLPVFFTKAPYRIRNISVLILYLSLIFSYRSVLVMIAVYMLIMNIRYGYGGVKKRVFLISFGYSLLSSGSFLLCFFLVFFFKKKYIKSKSKRKYLNIVVIMLVSVLAGSIFHKLLFFLNPYEYGSADDITIEAIKKISIEDIVKIFYVMVERSLLFEAIMNEDYLRVSIVVIELLLIIFLTLYSKQKVIKTIFILLLVSLLFEGLMTYSLLFSIIVLFYDFLYKSVKRTKYETRNIY
ncbi:hypothetical protein [Tenacibaculum amylolyticum]|uniref:hypothetical protein n=1 Tax=Tenacibaculum amylolyticum TaxID=104269 RepID=UPI00389424C1